MARLGTLSGCLLLACIACVGCSGDDDPEQPNGAATGGSAGPTGGSSGSGGSGNCDDRGCWVTLAQFQASSLDCADDYAAALDEYQNEPGEACTYAIFECRGRSGAAYQYGFTGDNVQCYYDDDGELVGGVRTSDHGASTMFGEVPSPGCYGGPICEDAGVASDGGGADALRACEVNSDCVITGTQCCLGCGQPSADEVTALHADRLAEYRAMVCADANACPDIDCAEVSPSFVASCVDHVCTAIALRDHAATACDAPSDCRVRASACCECGANISKGNLFAVSDEAAFSSLVCDPEQGCDGCVPSYGAQVTVSCSATQHCTLNDPR